MQLGLVGRLLHAHIDRSGNMPDLFSKLRRDFAIRGKIPSHDLHVQRSGQSEVQGLAHNIRGEEIEHGPGELAIELLAQAPDITAGRSVSGLERDQHVGIAGADQTAVAVAQANARIWNSNIVENPAEFFGRNFTPNRCFHLFDQADGLFNSCPAPGAQVQPKLPGIDRGEEILAQLRDQKPRTEAKRQETGGENVRMLEHAAEQHSVTVAKTEKSALEDFLDSNERPFPARTRRAISMQAPLVDLAVKPHHQRGNQRSGQDVARDHREYDGFCQWHKEMPRDTLEKKHRDEYNADTKSGDKRS